MVSARLTINKPALNPSFADSPRADDGSARHSVPRFGHRIIPTLEEAEIADEFAGVDDMIPMDDMGPQI